MHLITKDPIPAISFYELSAAYLFIPQLALRIEFQFDLDPVEASAGAHQHLSAVITADGRVHAAVFQAQIVAQIDSPLDDLSAAITFHGKGMKAGS